MPDELSVQIPNSAEQKRLDDAREKEAPWKQWGPYLSERQWGTVREDYSESGGDVGKAVALMVAITSAVLAFAPAVLGAVRDVASGYVWSFGLAAVIQFASMGIILFRRP